MSATASGSTGITPEQAAEEHALFMALFADSLILVALAAVGFLGSSLTVIAECLRGTLMASTEVFAYILMRRLHRGQLADLEFGTGKLEQIASFLIGAGMLAGAAWIFSGAFDILEGERAEGTPIWLALGASIGSINFIINVSKLV
jgi:divalent metal cation (Fe/Co/Zn/Cd) transporter